MNSFDETRLMRLFMHTGQQCNIRSSYATKASAKEDLKKMLAENPSGYYAVCPVVV